MILNRFNNLIKKSTSLLNLGREIIREGVRVYNERTDPKFGSKKKQGIHPDLLVREDPAKTALRENLKKNLVVPTSENPTEVAKQQSMSSSQGTADHSGSSYHGPGKAGEKTNANMAQRNFENHQGN